jgi:DNA-binding MarR family transcriptional regulator
MGERFLLYRLPEVPRSEIARRTLANRGSENGHRQKIENTVGDFLEQFVDCGRLQLPESFTEPIVGLTDIVTRARSGVPRNGYSREMLYVPEAEAPTRLAKQLAQLGAAVLAIGADPSEAWRLIKKAGWDSVPAVRCSVIGCLARQGEPVDNSTIQEETGLPETTAKRVVEDLVALKLARRQKDSGKWYVEQTAIAREYWASRHTFARIALQNGARIDWVQRQLGHSSITLTVDRYGRWERKAEKAEAEKLEGAFPVGARQSQQLAI